MSNTPKSIDRSVIDFCKSIVPTSIPEYVSLLPEVWCLENDCYNNVKLKVKKCGGKKQLGWRIQVVPDPYPKFMIEAVHHAIWISDSGQKVDITPQPASANRIVFISDDTTEFGKYRIGEKYHALIDSPIVKEYVRLCNLESADYISKTKLNKQPITPRELLEHQKMLLHKILFEGCN